MVATSVWTNKDQNCKDLLLFFIDGFFLVSNVDSPKSPPPYRASHKGDLTNSREKRDAVIL